MSAPTTPRGLIMHFHSASAIARLYPRPDPGVEKRFGTQEPLCTKLKKQLAYLFVTVLSKTFSIEMKKRKETYLHGPRERQAERRDERKIREVRLVKPVHFLLTGSAGDRDATL